MARVLGRALSLDFADGHLLALFSQGWRISLSLSLSLSLAVLEFELRASHLLGRCCILESHFQPSFSFYKDINPIMRDPYDLI
jgi:hypothetical protein